MSRWQQPGVQHGVAWQPQQQAGAVHDPEPSSSVVVAVVFEVLVVVFEAFVVDVWVVSEPLPPTAAAK